MPTASPSPASRPTTGFFIDERLLTEARRFENNVARASEAGIAQANAERKAEGWLRENRAALDSSNAWVDRHGLPLAAHRAF